MYRSLYLAYCLISPSVIRTLSVLSDKNELELMLSTKKDFWGGCKGLIENRRGRSVFKHGRIKVFSVSVSNCITLSSDFLFDNSESREVWLHVFLSACYPREGEILCVHTARLKGLPWVLMGHVSISGTNHSRKRVGVFWLARVLLAKSCGLGSGEDLRISSFIRTAWSREVRFPEGKRISGDLTIPLS